MTKHECMVAFKDVRDNGTLTVEGPIPISAHEDWMPEFDYQEMCNRAMTKTLEWEEQDRKKRRKTFVRNVVIGSVVGAIVSTIAIYRKK